MEPFRGTIRRGPGGEILPVVGWLDVPNPGGSSRYSGRFLMPADEYCVLRRVSNLALSIEGGKPFDIQLLRFQSNARDDASMVTFQSRVASVPVH
jgi:hypothetical protein